MRVCLVFLGIISISFGLVSDNHEFQARFLTTVNATWSGTQGCVSTNKTELMKHNTTLQLHLGSCDYGPITFHFTKNSNPGYLEQFSQYVRNIDFLGS